MKEHIRPAFAMLAAFTLLLGFAYPAAVTGVASIAFRGRASGSIVERNGKVVGCELIGQPFDDPAFFWGRPSATNPPCNASASGGSNLGPTDPAQADAVASRARVLLAADPAQTSPIPADLVTASGSGLDPHISPEAALFQLHRVAARRGLREDAVRALIARHVEGRTLGFLGEPRVNVLLLNLELETLKP